MSFRNLIFIYIMSFSFCYAQTKDSINNKYLEDQIYLGITYNILNNKPSAIVSKGFSNGISLGFIKDIPVNSQRNFGFAIGLGYGRNTFYQNLKITERNENTLFESLDNIPFDRNKFSFHALEIPFELRWRTSTSTRYKFWRIYTGVKTSYVFLSNAVYKDANGKTNVRNFSEVNRLQYGITLSAGHGTWNFNVYYGLNDLFNNAALDSKQLKFNDIRLGLIFYIL